MTRVKLDTQTPCVIFSKNPILFISTRGNANAQHILGLYYNEGSHGLTQSSERAIAFYTLAAEQGHVNAQFNLGLMYANGNMIVNSSLYN